MAAMTLNGKWIELFRAGSYGDKGSYSVGDIDKMIANFNPAEHEPPVVMGHPEMDAPAYGWVESLKRVGNVLMGKLKQVPDQFSQLVDEGRFKKRSISFYRTAKGPVLRHVGFLGAMPPEVKGLADVKLASFSAGAFQAIEFKEDEEMDVEQIKKSFAEALKEFFGIGGAPKLNLSEGDQSKAIEAAVAAAIKPLHDANTKLQQEFAEHKKNADKAQQVSATQAQQAFAEKQIARVKEAKRWIPAFDKMGLTQIFSELSKVETKISFGEGDKKKELPPAELFADFMIGLSEIVPTGEIASGAQRRTGKLVQFTEPSAKSGAVIDEQSVAIADAAKKLSEEKKISYGEALRQVRASGEFEVAGSVAAGAV